jgi:hypothetical protein
MILHVLIAMVAGWLQRHQQQVITYLLAENHVLNAQLRGRRLHLTDSDRRHLAALAFPLGRTRLKDMATIATPDRGCRRNRRKIYGRPFWQAFPDSYASAATSTSTGFMGPCGSPSGSSVECWVK